MTHNRFNFDICMRRLNQQHEQCRRDEQERMWNYLHGIESTSTSQGMKDHFVSAHAAIISNDALDELTLRWLPTTSKTVRRLATLYVNGPTRKLKDKETGEEIEGGLDAYLPWLSKEMVNLKMKDAHRLTKLTRVTILQTRWDHAEQRVKLDVIPPHLVIIVTDPSDPMRPVACGKWIMWREGDREMQALEWWTAEKWEIRVFDGDTKSEKTQWRVVAGDVNPIKRLPFAVFRDQISHHFWGEPRNSIIQTNLNVNFLITQLGDNAAFQSFGVGVATNLGLSAQRTKDSEDVDRKATRISPKTWLAVDQAREGELPPNLTFPAPPENMGAMRQTADWLLKMGGIMEGLGPNILNSEATEESGRALALKGVELKEERAADTEFAQDAERQLLDLWNAWQDATWTGSETHPDMFPAKTAKGDTTPEGVLAVDYDESLLQPDPEVAWQMEVQQIAKGLLSKIDWLKRQDPELTDDEAKLKLIRIMEDNQSGRPAGANLQNLVTPTEGT